MQDLLQDLYKYCEDHTKDPDVLLNEIERVTHLRTLAPRMISGKLQGALLSMLSKLKKPEYILEIGTFTGYSALHLAEGLTKNGKLLTIEVNEELAEMADVHFKKSRYAHQITLLKGDAKDLIPTIDLKFDLVFIDADKQSYSTYYDQIMPICNAGALIIVDNVLWSGKVIDQNKDKKTSAIHDFNEMVHLDTSVSNVILPFRDGLQLILKN